MIFGRKPKNIGLVVSNNLTGANMIKVIGKIHSKLYVMMPCKNS